MVWALLRPHDSEEASHADDHDNRFRHRQVGFSKFMGFDAAAEDGHSARQLKRRYVLAFFQKLTAHVWVGIEACASAHHWSRPQLQALVHARRCVMPPAYVKPYVKRPEE